MSEQPKCELCGEPMPAGEEMFKYHGYSGDCLKPSLPKPAAAPSIIEEVLAEVSKATKKFPTWPSRGLDALAVLGEEYGELNKEVLQMTYEPHKTDAAKIRKEAIQTAAMALRFIASLDRYDYTPGEQHEQPPFEAQP